MPKVDGLTKREKAPDLTLAREPGLSLEKEVKREFKPADRPKIEKTEPAVEIQPLAPLPGEPVQPMIVSPTKQQIESILAEDLGGIYEQLPRPLQAEFKAKGEEVAVKIVDLMQKAKVKIREIINLIKKWLKTIPGINRFFLEQEAKIKADKIMALRQS